jgi:flagellar biogenesis protein FliO
MSPLAKLLQINVKKQQQQQSGLPSALRKIWSSFIGLVRSARIQRRVRRLELVERVSINNKQSVALFRVDQREFVVGCCGDSVVLLVPPAGETAKAKIVKPRRKLKPKARKAPVTATTQIEQEKISKAAVNIDLTVEEKSTETIQLPAKTHVPSKAQLLKSFGRRLS